VMLTREAREQQWLVHRAWHAWAAAQRRAEEARAKYEAEVLRFREVEASARAEAS